MSYKSLIKEENIHPGTVIVLRFLDTLSMYELQNWSLLFAECSADNTLATKCKETIDTLLKGQQVSERDLLALAWVLRFNLYTTLDAMDKR